MRTEYNFSRVARSPYSGHSAIRQVASRSAGGKPHREEFGDEPLTQAQVRELRLRAADLDDPIRYLLVSRFGPKFALYYNVSDDVYVMNEPQGATLFKRKRAALAVRRLLGPRIQVLRCTTKRESGVRVPILGKPLRPPKRRAK